MLCWHPVGLSCIMSEVVVLTVLTVYFSLPTPSPPPPLLFSLLPSCNYLQPINTDPTLLLTPTCSSTHTHIHPYTHPYIRTPTYTHTPLHTHTHPYIRTHRPTHIRTCTPTHPPAQISAHTSTHTLFVPHVFIKPSRGSLYVNAESVSRQTGPREERVGIETHSQNESSV